MTKEAETLSLRGRAGLLGLARTAEATRNIHAMHSHAFEILVKHIYLYTDDNF